ncbi:hypothetical protein D9V37_10610 [Nocardioides mangrovicus]|uniref:Uncharacterized protein n=1 Tax=Nocardioides mangrovicus TaxID=2478913 RepID=A0A3L8P1J7_9ACTN|nr:hypothetical protein [Nocardioides mangrovicus]RLV49024.1 hypothetical protein D9V37_10610 [Nocardioides mangrovicus]
MTTTTDQQAIERYRYVLRTAPPEEIEEAHREAFARLTPAQRREVLAALREEATPAERARLDEEPATLARAATRAEMRRPGSVERALERRGLDKRSVVTGLLGGVAAAFVGSMVLDGLVDTGFGDGGLIDLAHDGPDLGGGFFDGFGF